MPNNVEEISLTEKNKTLKHLKRIVKLYDKPEHILNIIVQCSDNIASPKIAMSPNLTLSFQPQ